MAIGGGEGGGDGGARRGRRAARAVMRAAHETAAAAAAFVIHALLPQGEGEGGVTRKGSRVGGRVEEG